MSGDTPTPHTSDLEAALFVLILWRHSQIQLTLTNRHLTACLCLWIVTLAHFKMGVPIILEPISEFYVLKKTFERSSTHLFSTFNV